MKQHYPLIHHRHHHILHAAYPVTLPRRIYVALAPSVFLVLFFVVLKVFSLFPTQSSYIITNAHLEQAAIFTLLRLIIAYALAVFSAIALSLIASKNALTEKIFFPLFDITQSIPVLVFFPILISIFAVWHFPGGAAILIIALSMVWEITFTLIGGIKVIPDDILTAAKLYKLSPWRKLTEVTLPAIFPYLVTGSLLAWAEGWNIVIVAEVLHTFIPGGTQADDIIGLGSIMTHAIEHSDNTLFAFSMIVMVVMIGIMNFFIWQRLLVYAEKFKFD